MTRHSRLHRARIDRGIDLTDLAARTRLGPDVLRRIDEGRFAELPAGVYARSYVRAFASAVGLDPAEVVQELGDVLPAVEDPLDGLREAARQARATSGYGRAAARAAAAAVDAALLLAINGGLVHLVAAACGVEIGTLLEQAGAATAIFCAMPVALYFVVFSGVGGRTPGASLCRLPAEPATAPLRIGTILLRAVKI